MKRFSYPALIPSCILLFAGSLPAADQPQWGQRYTRNMVSTETGLPETFDLESGKNVKWTASLGNESYSTPVIANGRVIVGANNGRPRDPRHQGNRGILLCLDEQTGEMLWQLVVPKYADDYYLDWAGAGICSPATVEGERIYVVTSRNEVVCLDIHGQKNGNDGPFRDEGRFMAPAGQPPMEVTDIDADILWLFDMKSGVGVHHHDAAHSAILIDGQHLYLNTGNGVDRRHERIPSPDAPSLIVLDKASGQLVGQDGERMGPRIFHCTWSTPCSGVINGQRLILFGGGDGVCYGFKALSPDASPESVATLECVWRFDCDPTAPKENVHRYVRNRQVSPSNIKGSSVFYKDRMYVAVGGDIWWGKPKVWLKCIDATMTGDITKTGLVWSYELNRHCICTPAISDGMVFIGDCGRTFHCVDAETGQAYWTHKTRGEIWSSALVADGKVYVGTKRNEFLVFEASREKKLLASVPLESPTTSTPVAANGVLYVATLSNLHAVAISED
jgi:outer membrane protein assembly factor BamB